MDDQFRTSDADRDRVAAQLREHFAAGRLTREELDERLTVALSARTHGDLRRVLADLPGPGLAPRPAQLPPRVAPPWLAARRRPRILPLAALVLVAALVIPGAGWVVLAFFQVLLLAWLAACLAGIFLAGRIYRRARRDWWSGQHYRGHQHYGRHHDWPGGYGQHHYGYWRS